ncbi:hypothetical protein DIPPA_20705 [Diplonema papillatum]|nr:hypothetical protein DIPPA_20705 [Diplonema papillatum]
MVAAVPEPFGVPKGPFSMTYRERALRKKRRASRGPTAPAVGRCSDSDSSSSQSASPSSPFFSKTMWFEPSGWPDHSQQSWLTRVRNYLWVCCLLSWWTCELVVAAGPVRLMRWLFLLFRIVCFVVLLLYHVCRKSIR